MNLRELFGTARRALKPVLSDQPVFEMPGSATAVFYTPLSQRISQSLEMIIAGTSGVSLLIAWGIDLSGGPWPLRNLFVFLAFAVAGVPALSEVWGKLSEFRIDVDLLMLLGAGLAAYIGSPFEGALLLFLFALSGGLESIALRRTQSAIVAMRELAPTEATLLDGETMSRVPLRQVPVGAVVLVRPGEKVPVDGVVLEGSSSVDESAITGESIPRDCAVGDEVFAGTQNVDGRLEVRVTKAATDTTLAKIVELVTDARHHPATAQRLIDRIGPTYSVIVIVAAVCSAAVAWGLAGLPGGEAVRRGIALLIVASPCALIIATPVAYLSAIAAAARRGVLVKGGAHLEVIASAGAFAFDKTGTLTTGKVHLTDVYVDGGLNEEEALKFAGAIEASSSHPLAHAVNEALEDRGLAPYRVAEYKAIPGEGELGIIKGQSVWIGRPEMAARRLAQHAAATAGAGPVKTGPAGNRSVARRTEDFRRQGKTVSAMIVGDTVCLLAFQDVARAKSKYCVDRLREQGIKRLDMLTGDHQIIAEQVASRLGLDGYLGELSPSDKLDAIRRLREQFGRLVLVGDGINDAPALAHADAGIAMGSMGADVALEAADVVVMKDRIERVAWLHHHARRTAGIVKQNLTLAIAVIAVLSVCAVQGSVPLPLAVVGHEGSTVLVALNALRLLHTPPE